LARKAKFRKHSVTDEEKKKVSRLLSCYMPPFLTIQASQKVGEADVLEKEKTRTRTAAGY
jgi:hypothetical protein